MKTDILQEWEKELGVKIFSKKDLRFFEYHITGGYTGTFSTSNPDFNVHLFFDTNMSSSAHIPLGSTMYVTALEFIRDSGSEIAIVKHMTNEAGAEDTHWFEGNVMAIASELNRKKAKRSIGKDLEGLVDL